MKNKAINIFDYVHGPKNEGFKSLVDGKTVGQVVEEIARDELVGREVLMNLTAYCAPFIKLSLERESDEYPITWEEVSDAVREANAIRGDLNEEELDLLYDEGESALSENKQTISYLKNDDIIVYYGVSSWLGSHLKERGEAVIEQYGHSIWLCTGFGQALYMETVIVEIATWLALYRDLIEEVKEEGEDD